MGSVRRVRWWRAQTVVTTFALVAALMMVSASRAASSENETYRLPWDATETWQISRGPSDSGSHPSSYGYSAWDIFPVSLDEGIRTLAVGAGTASVFCDDGHQAHVKLVTEQGDTFHYAHLDSGSVSDAGITTDGVGVIQGQSMGTLYHDTDGYSLPCGSGTGPHLHFEIATAGLPVVIDGYTFSLSQQHDGKQLASTNTYVPNAASSFGLLSIADLDLGQDEVFLYRSDGTFRYYDVSSNGILGTAILEGDEYTTGWSAITAVDLDGDGQDEMFFYRNDGLFRYYHINPDGTLGSPILAGDGYTAGWSAITAVDLDGDGQDEMFFYREDGLFRYYNINPNGTIGSPILAGDGYTTGWSAITAVDLDGDGQDEMFFYRKDGLFRYYNINPDGTLGSPILAGNGYTKGWSAITAMDLDGDGQDEMFFYRKDGTFGYYDINADGTLGSPILAGNGYTADWSAITAIQLDK